MPPLALLKPADGRRARRSSCSPLHGYLVIATLLLIVKAIQLGAG